MREYHANGEGRGMCTGRPGWQVIIHQDEKRMKRKYFLLSDHLTPKHGVQEEDVPNQCKLLLESVSYTLSRKKNTLPCLQINLVDILKIDPDRRTVRCEPLVTMGQLTDTLDRFSL